MISWIGLVSCSKDEDNGGANGGPYAYIADADAGLRIIEISNPSSPQEVGYFVTPGKAVSVFVQ